MSCSRFYAPGVRAPVHSHEPSLAYVNSRLRALGIPGLRAVDLARADAIAPRARLLNALARAGYDRGARAYVDRIIGEVVPELPLGLEGKEPDSQTRGAANSGKEIDRMGSVGSEDRDGIELAGASARSGRRVHVYGRSGALTFETDVTKGGVPTISIDAASATSGGTSAREYDWKGKVRIQLTRAELPVVLGALLGAIPKAEFASHGQANDKGFSIEHQGAAVFTRVFARGQAVRAVQMTLSDAFYVAGLVVRQLREETPWLTDVGLISLVRATLGPRARSKEAAEEKAASGPFPRAIS